MFMKVLSWIQKFMNVMVASCMQFNMYLISSWIKFLFVPFVPKYLNFVMIDGNLLARLIIMLSSSMVMGYEHITVFFWKPTCSLVSSRTWVFFTCMSIYRKIKTTFHSFPVFCSLLHGIFKAAVTKQPLFQAILNRNCDWLQLLFHTLLFFMYCKIS